MKTRFIKSSGIYAIINNFSNKIYIGSSGNVNKRLTKHLNTLKNNTHENRLLQKDFNENPNITIITLPLKNKEEALTAEQEYLDKLKDSGRLLNISLDAKCAGRNWTNRDSSIVNETKRKLSDKLKNREFSIETRSKISEALKGKIVSEETKEKLRQANLGKKIPDNVKEKISIANKGSKRSPEVCKKISESKKGMIISEDWKKRLSEMSKRKPVMINGERFDSLKEASKKYNITPEGVSARIKSNSERFKNWNKI